MNVIIAIVVTLFIEMYLLYLTEKHFLSLDFKENVLFFIVYLNVLNYLEFIDLRKKFKENE